jgi:hypothetical protein
MASEVDICNEALANLGDSATVASINPPEGSAQAEHCQMFYPMARDTLLEMHEWNFATKRVLLAPVASPASSWGYAYALPNNMQKALAVLASDALDDTLINLTGLSTYGDFSAGVGTIVAAPQPYQIESLPDGTGIVLTNQPDAVLRYIERVTDTSKFYATFRRCLACALSSMLAGPVIKGSAGADAAARWQVMAYGRDGKSGLFAVAAGFDSNQRHTTVRDRHQAPWISMR